MVNMFVAVTDSNWFDLLSAAQPDEVNFWQPSGDRGFRAVDVGELFLFKLHSPNDFVVGGGVFTHASNVPLSIAWEAFGIKNGAESLSEMRLRIAQYRRDQAILDPRQDPLIGCRILTKPFFLARHEWIPVPATFAKNIVTGKRYSTEEAEGLALWDEIGDRFTAPRRAGLTERFGAPHLVRPRLGQGAFRIGVTDAYQRQCAVSGERTLPILDAAHIQSFAEGGPHAVTNGLLLRTDIHRLFDLGYVTLSEDRRFEVGRRLKDDFENGRHYYELHGSKIRDPIRPSFRPSEEALRWHREQRFLG